MEGSFDYQVKACKYFFVDNLPKLEYEKMANEKAPPNTNHLLGPKYDITGFNGHEVVALLCKILNDKYFAEKNQTFYLFIRGHAQDELQLFRIKANSTDNQPGNGVVSRRPTGRNAFIRGGAKSYKDLNDALEAYYDTKAFANHIKQLLKKKNTQIAKLPQATSEVYMIFLFEIARRLAKSEKPTDEQKKLDALPIGSAIAGFLRLLSDGQCTFKEVFLPEERFHCFTGTSEQRKIAIKNINKAIFKITKQNNNTEKHYFKELEELFCS